MNLYPYYIVTFVCYDEIRVLVHAEDVIEAGQKVIDTYSEGWGISKDRIDIKKVEQIKINCIIN